MLNWGWVQRRGEGQFNWAGTDRLIGALASHGVRTGTRALGKPGVGLRLSRQATPCPAERRSGLAQLPQGGCGSVWAGRHLLGDTLPQLYGPNATPVPIEAWQIWNEPNLSKFFAPLPITHASTPSSFRSPTTRSRAEDPKARIVLAGMPSYGDVDAWDFLEEPLRDARDQVTTSTSQPCTPTRATQTTCARRGSGASNP